LSVSLEGIALSLAAFQLVDLSKNRNAKHAKDAKQAITVEFGYSD
jgi:hypothetical protein